MPKLMGTYRRWDFTTQLPSPTAWNAHSGPPSRPNRLVHILEPCKSSNPAVQVGPKDHVELHWAAANESPLTLAMSPTARFTF